MISTDGGLDFLADYIFNEHHQYWYDEEPVISDQLKKVVNHHGATHPELRKLDTLFTTIKKELNGHFATEEQIIFPHIKNLVEVKKTGTPLKAGWNNRPKRTITKNGSGT